LSVAIVAADGGSYPVAELIARGYTVSVFNSSVGTPTLGFLAGFDPVLAYDNAVPSNPTALGNVLVDYVDAGGKLVLSTYGFSSPWAVTGRITTSGYAPLSNQGINGNVSGSLFALLPSDPIFNGVNPAGVVYFHNSNFAHPGLDSGATLIATDGAGNDMIARNAAGNIIGLNLFPAENFGNNTAFYDLLGNSLKFDSVTSVPEVANSSLLLLLGCCSIFVVRKHTLRRA
jgi:hypothetical protein